MTSEFFNLRGLSEEINKILNDAREEIIAEMKRQNKYVTGTTANAIQVETSYTPTAVTGKITAPISLLTLETGRRGGKIPSDFTHILLVWSMNKRLTFKTWKERVDFASLTARKIAAKGSKIYRSGRRQDVYSSILLRTTERIQKKCDEMGDLYDVKSISTTLPTTKISFVF